MKRFWVFIVLVAAGSILFFQRVTLKEFVLNLNKKPLPVAVSYQHAVEQQPTVTQQTASSTPTKKPNPAPQPTNTKPPIVLKNALNLAVPFQPQAPFGDWSELYENACEEASLSMVDHYLRAASLSKQQMKDEIDAMVAWQVTNWSGHNNLPIEKVMELAKAFYPLYTIQILHDLSPDTIKQQLMFGTPVIVPSAGRELGNPNFRGQGPLYHMLVIKGYTEEGKFITNDPGTRHGADFLYDPDVLLAAVRDWDGDSPDGPKRGLVIYK